MIESVNLLIRWITEDHMNKWRWLSDKQAGAELCQANCYAMADCYAQLLTCDKVGKI